MATAFAAVVLIAIVLGLIKLFGKPDEKGNPTTTFVEVSGQTKATFWGIVVAVVVVVFFFLYLITKR